ncbi:MAG TPA: copper homeostasis protein CutC, partial [Cyclobacteriaceae bacterium]|nr:copper homeostasis protein CutC [Cyclobacteriaceae bacterium]
GVVEALRPHITMDIFAMVRPRGGDFLYSSYEYYAMKRDILAFQKLSVDGVVLGILNPDGTIDKKRCRTLIDMARPLKVTIHRAFDMTRDPFQALEDCIEVGFDRILTSGQKAKAFEAVDLIAELVKRADGRISIMPGSGVNESNVVELVSKTGVKEIHFSASAMKDSEMQFQNKAIAGLGSEPGAEYKLRTVNVQMIKNIRALLG